MTCCRYSTSQKISDSLLVATSETTPPVSRRAACLRQFSRHLLSVTVFSQARKLLLGLYANFGISWTSSVKTSCTRSAASDSPRPTCLAQDQISGEYRLTKRDQAS